MLFSMQPVVYFQTNCINIFSGRVIRCQKVDTLMTCLGNILADHLVNIVILVGDTEIITVAAFPRKF